MIKLSTLMPRFSFGLFALALFAQQASEVAGQEATGSGAGEVGPQPIRALLIAGGCCHDYAAQQEAISLGIQQRANVRVDVYWTDNSTTAPVLPLYRKLDWAADYDVIIHDECAADITDAALVNRIVQVHQEIPAVHLHCAMHSFRTGSEAWFKHLGLQSSGHGPQLPIEIEFAKEPHPITATLADWTTINEELYNNVQLFGAIPLAVGRQRFGNGNEAREETAVVAWINESAGARSFSTTIGHNTETVQDTRYLDLVTRGLLWACDKLNDDYLQPYAGTHELTFIDANSVASSAADELGERPTDARLVGLSVSSTQQGHPAFHAIDGDEETRWCADGDSFPQSFTMSFEQQTTVTGIELVWEMDRPYRYRIEGSVDGENWNTLIDHSRGRQQRPKQLTFESPSPLTQLRVVGVGSSPGSWCSIREVKLLGEGLEKLWPAEFDAESKLLVPIALSNQYESRGNIPPRIEVLTPEQEAKILEDVTIPEGFEATVFAAPPAVNYPVFVASTVDGTVFVSSDGNGSLGRQEERGRVIRLRDLDGDGRADETKVFCEVDAPRGLVWDHDRLYLMHPPHLSVFIDHDGDGVADVQKRLVKNLAFGYEARPADHTTNGLSLGPDGWLYIAGGDFGFLDAEGADGTRLTHRGGGVIRVRPDGTGLEVYSTGTRNILEVAISPKMELFARDNTNDGGGWDVRLHHFTGNDDHGYPRLYKNFNDECVQPLADYGGGSGCGAVYIDEPGMGEWSNAPFTADWGTGAIYRHTVTPAGATYQESAAPKPFIRMTRPTDADVDGNSRVYAASWIGATFDWAGPDVGYLVCVRPKEFTPAQMPDFDKASDEELSNLLDDSSYRRRMEAQRTLMRRGNKNADRMLTKALAERTGERQLLAQLQDDSDARSTARCVEALAHVDPVVVHTAVRVLAKRMAVSECLAAFDAKAAPRQPLLRALAMMHRKDVVEGLIARLERAEVADRLLLLGTLARLHYREGIWSGDSWGTRPDTRGPYYQPTAWEESQRIVDVLMKGVSELAPKDSAQLLELMLKNRIERDDALQHVVDMARQDKKLIPTAIEQLVNASHIPNGTLELLQLAMETEEESHSNVNAIRLLARLDTPQSVRLLVLAMSKQALSADAESDRSVASSFASSRSLGNQVQTLVELSRESNAMAVWAMSGLLVIVGSTDSSPEARESAQLVLEQTWDKRTLDWIKAAVQVGNHTLDQRILQARGSSDPQIAAAADTAVKALGIQMVADDTPQVKSLSSVDAIEQIVSNSGDLELGKQVFAKANCAQCHALTTEEVQKGPYLGNIARTFKRVELAQAVLEPSKTIAQGFATNIFLTVDGQVFTGFVTDEQSDQVTFRDQQGKATTLKKEDIEERKTSTQSIMPAGVLDEFTIREAASLIDYIQSLAE